MSIESPPGRPRPLISRIRNGMSYCHYLLSGGGRPGVPEGHGEVEEAEPDVGIVEVVDRGQGNLQKKVI